MAKIPNSPSEVFEAFTADVKSAFGNEIVSIILYGSGASGEYVARKSDINFLIVLSDHVIGEVSKAFPLIKKWRKSNVAVPFFMTEAYLQSSLDSFPIEFLQMKRHHQVLYGKDVLENVEISKKYLRLEGETQIKGKLLHLRREFLATLGDHHKLQKLIEATIPVFTSVFSALLQFKDLTPVRGTRAIYAQAAETFALDRDLFARVVQTARREVRLSTSDLIRLTEQYILEIRKLAMIIDQWEEEK
jgi:hypothetical protein